MYIPAFNVESRIPVLHALMKAHPLATVVTLTGGGLFATHLPMIVEADGSEFGVLRGHLAKANVQWKESSDAVEALAIFLGDEHYISPNWYTTKSEHGKVVPTWNYTAVHAYGPLRVIQDADWLLAHVTALTNVHEAGSPVPWKVDDAPGDYMELMLKAIVGIEIPIARLEGKAKVSQNREARDREGVVKALDSLDTPGACAMARLVERR
jgi:transcriptional regulator